MSPRDEQPETEPVNTGGIEKSTSGPPPPPKPLSPETIQRILKAVEEHKKESGEEVA